MIEYSITTLGFGAAGSIGEIITLGYDIEDRIDGIILSFDSPINTLSYFTCGIDQVISLGVIR
jgi:hypothetical protein